MRDSLSACRFFKLIAGASLTDADRLAEIALIYSLAGVDCLDVACDLAVVEALDQMMSQMTSQRMRRTPDAVQGGGRFYRF